MPNIFEVPKLFSKLSFDNNPGKVMTDNSQKSLNMKINYGRNIILVHCSYTININSQKIDILSFLK